MMNYSSIRRNRSASLIEQVIIGGVTLSKSTLTTRALTLYGPLRVFFGNPTYGPQVQVFDAAGKCCAQYDLPKMTGTARALLATNCREIGIAVEGSVAA